MKRGTRGISDTRGKIFTSAVSVISAISAYSAYSAFCPLSEILKSAFRKMEKWTGLGLSG
jgi:hypothetical protein